jgi:hypothetical protein
MASSASTCGLPRSSLLGRGKRLFEDGLATQWLTRLETNTYDDMVAVRYASAS